MANADARRTASLLDEAPTVKTSTWFEVLVTVYDARKLLAL